MKLTKEFLQSVGFIQYVLDNGVDVFWVRDPTYTIQLYISKSYEKVWGRNVEELYGNPGKWVEYLLPEDVSRVTDCIKTRGPLVKPGDQYEQIYRIVRPDGSIRLIVDNSYSVFDGDSHLGFAGIAKDITDEQISYVSSKRYRIVHAPESNKVSVVLDTGVNISHREITCLYYLLRGYSATKIADICNISNRTVETYLNNLKEKLNCPDKTSLIEFAFDYKLYSINLGV